MTLLGAFQSCLLLLLAVPACFSKRAKCFMKFSRNPLSNFILLVHCSVDSFSIGTSLMVADIELKFLVSLKKYFCNSREMFKFNCSITDLYIFAVLLLPLSEWLSGNFKKEI